MILKVVQIKSCQEVFQWLLPFIKLIKELLGMRSSLGWGSSSNMLLYLFPLFAK